MKLSDQEREVMGKETRNILARYKDARLIDALLDEKTYTKKGRLNRSALARYLGATMQITSTRLTLLQEFLASKNEAV